MTINRKFWLDKITLLVVLLIAIGSYGCLYSYLHPEPYNPFGKYPEQQIISQKENADGTKCDGGSPSLCFTTVHIITGKEIVTVIGEKCIKGNDFVEVTGKFQWHEIAPPGFFTTPKEGTAKRKPGADCELFSFKNPVPQEALNHMAEQAAEGTTRTTWEINGEETPTRPGNNVTKYYSSETFVVVYNK